MGDLKHPGTMAAVVEQAVQAMGGLDTLVVSGGNGGSEYLVPCVRGFGCAVAVGWNTRFDAWRGISIHPKHHPGSGLRGLQLLPHDAGRGRPLPLSSPRPRSHTSRRRRGAAPWYVRVYVRVACARPCVGDEF